jgi:hypothetical protein
MKPAAKIVKEKTKSGRIYSRQDLKVMQNFEDSQKKTVLRFVRKGVNKSSTFVRLIQGCSTHI